MRDNTKPRSNGRPCMSKGFGFVAFTVHEHALAAAMATNNATTFGEKKVIKDDDDDDVEFFLIYLVMINFLYYCTKVTAFPNAIRLIF